MINTITLRTLSTNKEVVIPADDFRLYMEQNKRAYLVGFEFDRLVYTEPIPAMQYLCVQVKDGVEFRKDDTTWFKLHKKEHATTPPLAPQYW